MKREKTGKKPEKDPATGHFLPGNNGGDGRPPGARNFTSKVREALEKISEVKDPKTLKNVTYEVALIKSIFAGAIIDRNTATQKLIWNYLDGMPLQPFAPVNPDGSGLFDDPDPAVRAEIEKRFNMNLKK